MSTPNLETFEQAAADALELGRAQGCCCLPEVHTTGWIQLPNGNWHPLIRVAHDEWCPLMRSVEQPVDPDAVEFVGAGEGR